MLGVIIRDADSMLGIRSANSGAFPERCFGTRLG